VSSISASSNPFAGFMIVNWYSKNFMANISFAETWSSKKKQEVEVENEVMTNDDILGDAIPSAQQIDMQKICCMALGVESHANSHFPGSQPVLLDRAHLQLLRQRYYYATWKADGTRYMILITRDGCYLIDRKFNFRRVQLRFPKKGCTTGFF
jgi:mRNA-capping enzyme